MMARAVFGIDEIEAYSEERVLSFLEESQRRIPCRQIVASVQQQDDLIRIDSDTMMMQHRAQPVQVMYFDGDSLLFYHINCYTQSGFMRYDWNNKGSFGRFPPSPTVVPDWHGRMTLTEYQRCLPGLQRESRYTVLVLWSNMLRKVSTQAVEAVAANVSGREDCTVWLVNTDRWWVDYMHRQ